MVKLKPDILTSSYSEYCVTGEDLKSFYPSYVVFLPELLSDIVHVRKDHSHREGFCDITVICTRLTYVYSAESNKYSISIANRIFIKVKVGRYAYA